MFPAAVPYSSCDMSARSREKKSAVESVRVETPSGERVYEGEATSGMGFRGEVHACTHRQSIRESRKASITKAAGHLLTT